jgi:hypothetical protein
MNWRLVLRVGGTVVLAGLSAFGAATLVSSTQIDLGFKAATMAAIAAFVANVFRRGPGRGHRRRREFISLLVFSAATLSPTVAGAQQSSSYRRLRKLNG